MKLYIWRDTKTGCEFWCINKTLKLAQKYMKSIYHTADGFFDNPPNKIYKTPLAASVLDPLRTFIYKTKKED